ncbi:hypothetical protein J7K28_05680 [Candidatus Aerophobetes bacterium]|nr:hypothetical protein [Candidatus Aerophobetes bacterium]
MTKIPDFIVGCNDHFSTSLNAEDMNLLTAIGLNSMKIPVYGKDIGSDEVPFFQKKNKENFDFSQLDRRLELLAKYNVIPVICPHKGNQWGPGFIIDDLMYEDTKRHTQVLVEHIHKKFGPVIYGFFETELDGRYLHQEGNYASYYYQYSKSFKNLYIKMLKIIYKDIDNLNASYKTSYSSFEECPLPSLGKVPLKTHRVQENLPTEEISQNDFPLNSIENIIYFDLKRIISQVSAERYNEIGKLIKEVSPGSEYWGPCIQLEFLLDARQIHSDNYLSPVGPTPSDLAKQPQIDCLHVDTYRETPFLEASEWKIAAKIAKNYNKKLIISEVGGENGDKFIKALDGLLLGADNLRGAMIWDAKSGESSEEGFGILDKEGNPRKLWYEQAKKFFSTLIIGKDFYKEYHKGDIEVYFPDFAFNLIQSGNMPFKKIIYLMADLFEMGYKPEPIFDDEVQKGNFSNLWVYSYYMAPETIKKLKEVKGKRFVVFQQDAHSPGIGRNMEEIWSKKFNFKVSSSHSNSRPMERCQVLGSFFSPPEISLCYPPFWDVEDPEENEVIAYHSSLYQKKIMGIRTKEGSFWFDEYFGFKDYFGRRHFVQICNFPRIKYEPASFGHRQSVHYSFSWFNQKDRLLIVGINHLRTDSPLKILVKIDSFGYNIKKAYKVENLTTNKIIEKESLPDKDGILSFSTRIPGNEKYVFLIKRSIL